VHAQDLVIDECGNRQTIKNILKFFPEANTIPAFTLVVKAIDTVDLAALVVASEQEEVLLELDLVQKQQDDGFK